MPNKFLKLFFVAACALALQACAHGDLDRKIDAKLAEESNVQTNKDLRAEARQAIDQDSSLTADQKAKLKTLQADTRKQLDGLNDNSIRLRAVLVKDLLTTSYNEDEAELIKERLRKNEDQRLKVQFDAIEQVNQILGHQAPNRHEWISHSFFEPATGQSF